MTGRHGFEGHIGVCPTCRKRSYPSRKIAKKVAHEIRSQGRMSVYRCGDVWHLGHLPQVVIKGIANRDQIINRRSER